MSFVKLWQNARYYLKIYWTGFGYIIEVPSFFFYYLIYYFFLGWIGDSCFQGFSDVWFFSLYCCLSFGCLKKGQYIVFTCTEKLTSYVHLFINNMAEVFLILSNICVYCHFRVRNKTKCIIVFSFRNVWVIFKISKLKRVNRNLHDDNAWYIVTDVNVYIKLKFYTLTYTFTHYWSNVDVDHM